MSKYRLQKETTVSPIVFLQSHVRWTISARPLTAPGSTGPLQQVPTTN